MLEEQNNKQNSDEQVEQISEVYCHVIKEYYQTNEVAEMLGIDAQKLRNICNQFDTYLAPIEKTKGNHRHYSKKNIEQLKHIVEELNSGVSVPKLQERYKELKLASEGVIEIDPTEPEDERVFRLFQSMKDNIRTVLNEVLDEKLENMNALSNSAYLEELNSNKQEIQALTEQIQLLREEINILKEQNQEPKKKHIFGKLFGK